jgi:ABC-type glycerol-3-phosphate transport system substrate-binding protein
VRIAWAMRVRRVVALLAVTALTAAGCGSDSAAPSKHEAKAKSTPAKQKPSAPTGY